MGFFRKEAGNRIEFAVYDMHCEHCEAVVKDAIRKVDGIKDVRINKRKKQAIVTVALDKEVSVEDLISAVNATGYRAEK